MVEPPGLRDAIEQAFTRLGLELARRTEQLDVTRAELAEAKAALAQVDDILIVNFIAAKDNDYRQAVFDLMTTTQREVLDPQISEAAAALKAQGAREERQKEREWLASIRIHAVAGPTPEFAAAVRHREEALDMVVEYLDQRDKEQNA